MDEYIKREDALKAIQTVRDVMDECKRKYHSFSEPSKSIWSSIIDTVERVINRIPPADVVEVVRCKDCKWWHTNACAFRNDCADGLPCADDFCSHGERKE